MRTRTLAFLIAAFACILLVLWAVKGTRVSPDSRTYDKWAQQLVSNGGSYVALYSSASSTAPPLMYTGIITLVALCRMVAGPSWMHMLVVLNILSLITLAYLLLRTAGRLSAHKSSVLVCAGFLLIGFDLFQWVRYALSDTTYLLLGALAIGAALSPVLKRREIGERPEYSEIAAVALSALASFYRPTGILLWPAVLFALYACRRTRRHELPRPKILLAAIFIVAAGAITANAALMHATKQAGLTKGKTIVAHQARRYALGEVVWDRRETWLNPPDTLLDHATITLTRGIWFWAPTCYGFSHAHTALNLIFFVPLYGLATVTLRALFRADNRLGREEQAILWTLVVFVFTTALFHAIIQVDHDWRYRVPALPALIVLASLGPTLLSKPALSPARE